MKIFWVTILFYLFSFFSSCEYMKALANPQEHQNEIMKTWVGDTKQNLYLKWGAPSRVTDDGNGGEIAVFESYVNSGQQAGRAYENEDGSISYTNPQQRGYVRTRMFYIDKNGIIYNWKWKGL